MINLTEALQSGDLLLKVRMLKVMCIFNSGAIFQKTDVTEEERKIVNNVTALKFLSLPLKFLLPSLCGAGVRSKATADPGGKQCGNGMLKSKDD